MNYKDHLFLAQVRREGILELLSRYHESDITEYTAPSGMTCNGIAEKMRIERLCAFRNLKWLCSNGYVRVACTRRVGGMYLRGNRSDIYIVTEKGRNALRTTGANTR